MKNKFITRSITSYKKLVFIGYMQEIMAALDKVTSDEAKQLVINIKKCYDDYMSACNDEDTKAMTSVMTNAIGIIDTCWTGMRNVVKGLSDIPEASTAQTAGSVLDIFNRYGYIVSMSYKEKLGAAEYLLGYLDTVDADKFESLGITTFKTAMKTAFDEYHATNLARKALREANFQKRTKARAALEQAYTMLVYFVEAVSYIGSTDYDEFVVMVNRIDVSRIKAEAEKAEAVDAETETSESSDPELQEEDAAVASEAESNPTIG